MSIRIYLGPPGSGKTRSVKEEFSSIYFKDPNKGWWCDRCPSVECVLVDGFSGARQGFIEDVVTHSRLNRWTVIIVSNLEIADWNGGSDAWLETMPWFLKHVDVIKRFSILQDAPQDAQRVEEVGGPGGAHIPEPGADERDQEGGGRAADRDGGDRAQGSSVQGRAEQHPEGERA